MLIQSDVTNIPELFLRNPDWHVAFDVDRCVAYARQVNPRIEVLMLSATRGDGVAAWYAWLHRQLSQETAG